MKYFKLEHIIILILLVVLLFKWQEKPEKEYLKIPPKTNTKIIENPIEVKVYDTIREKGKTIIKEVPSKPNDSLLNLYEQAKDSISKLNLYKESITERKYIETLEDSVQKITVKSHVIGTLKSQTIQYITKEQSILIPTLQEQKTKVFIGLQTSIPVQNYLHPSIGVKLHIKRPKKLYSVGYDNQKNIIIGIAFKL